MAIKVRISVSALWRISKRARLQYWLRPTLPRAALTSMSCRWSSTLTCPIFRKLMFIALAAQGARGRRERRFLSAIASERPYLADIEKLIGKRIPLAGEIPHAEKENERTGRESGQRKTTNVRTRRKPVSENASAEEVAADVAREKAAKQKARKMLPRSVPPARKKRQRCRKNSAQKQLRRAQESLLQPVHGAAVNDPYARYEKNEPRVDAHTPSRAYALSEEAAARIRKKVEDALAARAQKASAPAQSVKKNTKPAVRRRRRSAK